MYVVVQLDSYYTYSSRMHQAALRTCTTSQGNERVVRSMGEQARRVVGRCGLLQRGVRMPERLEHGAHTASADPAPPSPPPSTAAISG